MSRETEPTLPLVLPLYETSLKILQSSEHAALPNPELKTALTAAKELLLKYYDFAKQNYSYQIATSELPASTSNHLIVKIFVVLHPGFRLQYAASVDAKEQAMTIFKHVYDIYSKDLPDVSPSPAPPAASSEKPHGMLNMMGSWMQSTGGDQMSSQQAGPAPQTELERYFSGSDPLSWTENPLPWYKVYFHHSVLRESSY